MVDSLKWILPLVWKRCQTGVVAAIAVLCASHSSAQETVETVAQLVRQIDAQVAEMEKDTAADSAPTAKEFSEQLSQLVDRSVMIFGKRKAKWKQNCQTLRESVDFWTSAAGADPKRRGKASAEARKAWAAIKSAYPQEALQLLPPLWSCPMHSELMEDAPKECPICGMSLEPIYVTQPELSQLPAIRAEIETKAPLEAGQKAELRIRLLFNSENRPVELSDLEETHTRKIHLLITDLSQTDYHHEHPEALGNGEYASSFTPALPGTYRVWADLKPSLTHIQQFSIADIPSTTPRQGALARDEPENRHAEVDGYRFDLSFENSTIVEKDTVPGVLHVTGPDGLPFTRLEVVMGAFGHFVGFREDFSSVLHIHPVGTPLVSPESAGGPDLPFYFRSNHPGLVRFFAQVKIEGKDFFPRFVLKVLPLQQMPKN